VARTHGKDLNFSFNAVAIEDELDTATINFAVAEADITAFADIYQNFLAGKKNVTIDIGGSLDPAASQGVNTLFDAVGGGVVATVLDPTGSGPDTNDPEYQCAASAPTGSLVASLSISFPVGDKASYSASIQNSGATTRVVS